MRELNEISTGVFYLGTVGMPPTTAIYLIRGEGESCIVEPGPNSASDTVARLIQEAGIKADYVKKIIATHIHLDHAGASRALLEKYNFSKLYVYQGAKKHLVDTTALIASASQILGPLFKLWGGMPSVPAERIEELNEGSELRVGNSRISIIYTPGHAPYHMSILHKDTQVLHTGDAVGMYIKNRKTLWPASPLPSFRYDLEMQTLAKIKELKVKALMIPHYGPVEEVKEFLDLNFNIYETWHRIIGQMKSEEDVEVVARRLVAEIDSYSWIPQEPHFWFTLKMHVSGFLKYEKELPDVHTP